MSERHRAANPSSRRSSASAREDSPSRGRNKRHQIAVACNACRRRKTKCDGSRPVCSVCASKKSDCTWSADPDATPMVAMKRKYQTLESETRDLGDLVNMLIERPRQESLLILDHLRRTRDTSSTLAFVREGDLLTWGLTTTADADSNPPNSALSDPASMGDITDGVESMMPPNHRARAGSSASANSSKDTAKSPKKRLAISDLVNNNNT